MDGNDYLRCTIEFSGFLPREWDQWFDSLEVKNLPDGHIYLQGVLPDQSILLGILAKIGNLGMEIYTLKCQRVQGRFPPGGSHV